MARTTIHPTEASFKQALKNAKAAPDNFVQPIGNPDHRGEIDLFVERDPQHDYEIHAIHQLSKL